MNSEPRPLNVPPIYNLITDPKEEYEIRSESTWVLPVLFEKIVEFESTLVEEPPVPLGVLEPYEPEKGPEPD